jgi:hypothetical protein
MLIFIFILIGITYSQVTSLYQYNYNNEQLYDIDLQYNSIPGTNMYAYSTKNDTLFITDIIPESQLMIRFKLYTNDDYIIGRIKTGSLYVGIDFNTNHTVNKKTDVVLCNFTRTDVTCRDYLYYIDSDALMPNTPGFPNQLIPMGITNATEVLFFDNVYNYTAYFELMIIKDYPAEFKNSTMLKFFLEDAPNADYTVYTFYGPYDDSRIGEVYANYTLHLQDGYGLPNKSSYLNIKLIFYLILFFIF